MLVFIFFMLIMCASCVWFGYALTEGKDNQLGVSFFIAIVILCLGCIFVWFTCTEFNTEIVSISDNVTLDDLLEEDITVLHKYEDGTYLIWEVGEDKKTKTIE